MQIKPLYKYKRPDGGITVSPTKPENTGFTEEFRLIADDGKLLTKDGINTTPCVDVESSEGWHEVDDPEYGKEQIENTEIIN